MSSIAIVGLAITIAVAIPAIKTLLWHLQHPSKPPFEPRSPDEEALVSVVRNLTEEPVLTVAWKAADTAHLVTHDVSVMTGYVKGPRYGWGHIFQFARTETNGWVVAATSTWVS